VVQGHFRLGVHVSLALFTLKHFLPKFMKSHPDFHLSLSHDLSRKITEQVVSHKLDLGIVVNPVRHPDLVIQDLYTDEVSFRESPKNINSDILIVDDQLIQSQFLMKKNNFKRIITTSSLEVVLSLTESGAGVGIIPGRVAALSHLKLEKSKKNTKSFTDKICLVYRPESRKLLAMDVLIQDIVLNLKNK
jgi:DNA-binding transcriptional LysR family regulator